MPMWIVWAAVGALLLLYFSRRSTPAEANLDPQQLRDLMAGAKDLQLIDVRSPEEYAQGHLSGAKLMPLDGFAERLGELDAQRPLVLYCLSGSRSAWALKLLLERGYPGSKHLAGGLAAWQRSGLPLAP